MPSKTPWGVPMSSPPPYFSHLIPLWGLWRSICETLKFKRADQENALSHGKIWSKQNQTVCYVSAQVLSSLVTLKPFVSVCVCVYTSVFKLCVTLSSLKQQEVISTSNSLNQKLKILFFFLYHLVAHVVCLKHPLYKFRQSWSAYFLLKGN